MISKKEHRLWGTAQVKDFVRRAKGRVGDTGWAYLSNEMREGLIAREFAMVLIGNDHHDIPGTAIHALYADMLDEAGLNS